MKKTSLFFLTILLLLTFSLSSNALAEIISVVDTNTGDRNIITSQGRSTGSAYIVDEDYNETQLVPYPSHDGWAIVNSSGEFFTKLVEVAPNEPIRDFLIFNVTNTTPYVWSDYHFILNPYDTVNFVSYHSSVFQLSKQENYELSFWSDDPSFWVNPGNTVSFALEMDAPWSFSLTQTATSAVPLPGAIWLLGSGLFGLIGIRRRIIN